MQIWKKGKALEKGSEKPFRIHSVDSTPPAYPGGRWQVATDWGIHVFDVSNL